MSSVCSRMPTMRFSAWPARATIPGSGCSSPSCLARPTPSSTKSRRKPLAEVIGFPRTMTHYCRKSAAEGLATWWGDEKQLPEAHGATALALTKHYGLSDATVEYFYEHVRADLEHTEHSFSLFEGYVRDRGDVVRGRRAAAVTLWAWREMHDGILRYLRKKYDF